MKRITPKSVMFAALLVASVGIVASALAASTPAPTPTAAIVKARVFNDCPTSTLVTTNNYPDLISFDDSNIDCFGFANLHVWTLSEDGVNEAVFDNPAHFRLAMNFKIDGNGEGGLRISPWWSHDADGLFNVRSTDGEIACFGGRLPFFSFTGAFGLHYAAGNWIHLEAIYEPHSLNAGGPGTIEYKVSYLGTDYTSGVLPFDQGNPAEDPPHGLYGILNDARVGGHFKAFLAPGGPPAKTAKATFANISFTTTPVANSAVLKTRVFNDCPTSTLLTNNGYPGVIQFWDQNIDCFGFANLHVWRFSENGVDPAIYNNNAKFRFTSNFIIEGSGNGEGGLQVSPWWSQDVDGLFNVRSTDGEIACFGGRLPFFTFTGAFGLHYVKGTVITLGIAYDPHARTAADPATIEYTLTYNGTDYTSGPLPFDQGNPAEDPPHTLYGMLNDGQAGGAFKAFLAPNGPPAKDVKATFFGIHFSTCVHPTAVYAEVKPHTVNAKSKAKYVKVSLEPAPPPYASDIDVASLRLNGVAPTMDKEPKISGDNYKLDVWFPRSALVGLPVGERVPVWITGDIGAYCFESVAYLKVKSPIMPAPAADAQVAAGSLTEVKWALDPDTPADKVSLVASFDGGASWHLQAADIRNTGSYMWQVPDVATGDAQLVVVTGYLPDGNDYVSDAEISASAPFSIVSPTGVIGGEASFALRAKNPSTGGLQVSFSLPTAKPATLAVFDVTGRQVVSREVGGTLGWQSLKVGSDLPAGMYIVKLSATGRSITNRVVVIR